MIENDENKNLIDDAEESKIGMSEVDAFDFERAVMLMSVMEKCANVAPKSTAISGLAAAALNEMNEEAKVIGKRRAEEFAKIEAAAAQKRAEEERAQREDEEAKAAQAKEDADNAARVTPRAIPRVQVEKSNGDTSGRRL